MYSVFERLCEEKGVTPYKVSKDLGWGTSVFSNWKAGRYTPKMDKIQKIADYFRVSPQYIMTGEEEERESITGKKYYFSDETAEIAQEVFDSADLRLLFEAARGSRSNAIRLAAEMLRQMKDTNPDG